MDTILCFNLDELNIGISIQNVKNVMHAIDVTVLPGAPDIVQGVINIGGELIPIVDVRQRFKLREKVLELNDSLIIAEANNVKVGLYVDNIVGLVSIDECESSEIIDKIPGNNAIVKGITHVNNEIVLIHDINQFLTVDEENRINEAIVNGAE